MDYFVLDMKDKKITLYDESINDSFISSIKNIKKIDVLKLNSILTYIELPLLEEIGDNFLEYNRYLERFIEPNLRKIGRYVLSHNSVLTDIDISNLLDEYKNNLSKHMKEMLKQETPYTLKLKY